VDSGDAIAVDAICSGEVSAGSGAARGGGLWCEAVLLGEEEEKTAVSGRRHRPSQCWSPRFFVGRVDSSICV
jgi:hypothetical protein